MPRALRPLVADGHYHVYTRALPSRDLFADDAERRLFIATAGRVVTERDWRCLSYCLMSNHVHLVVQTPRPDLHLGMRDLLGTYAGRVLRARGQRGPMFERRYGAKLVLEDSHLAEALRYVALNPVRAGLCAHPSQWPWSSHAALAGDRPLPGFLASERVYDLVKGLGGGSGAAGYASLVAEAVGGRAAWVACATEAPRAVPGPSLRAILSPGSDASVALAYLEHGFTMGAIARELGCAVSTVSRRVRRHERAHAQRNGSDPERTAQRNGSDPERTAQRNGSDPG